MSSSHEQAARDYVEQLPAHSPEENVRRLIELLGRFVAEERRACAEIAEDTMRLYGSHAAEQVALRIRAREEDNP